MDDPTEYCLGVIKRIKDWYSHTFNYTLPYDVLFYDFSHNKNLQSNEMFNNYSPFFLALDLEFKTGKLTNFVVKNLSDAGQQFQSFSAPYNNKILILPAFKKIKELFPDSIEPLLSHEYLHMVQFELMLLQKYPFPSEGAAYLVQMAYHIEKNERSVKSKNELLTLFDSFLFDHPIGKSIAEKDQLMETYLYQSKKAIKVGIDKLVNDVEIKQSTNFQSAFILNLKKLLEEDYYLWVERRIADD